MGVIIKEHQLNITTESKIIYFNLPKFFCDNLKHEADFIIKDNDILAEHTTKTILLNYCPNTNMKQYPWTQKTVKKMNHTNFL